MATFQLRFAILFIFSIKLRSIIIGHCESFPQLAEKIDIVLDHLLIKLGLVITRLHQGKVDKALVRPALESQ